MRRDYAAIRGEYVEGHTVDGERVYPSLEELAEKHGVNFSNLRARSGKEKWRVARGKFALKVQHAREEQRAMLLGSQAARLDARAAIFAIENLERARTRAAALKGKFRPDELKTLVDAAEKAHAMGRRALGQPLDPAPPDKPGSEAPNLDNATLDDLKALREIYSRLAP